MCYYYYEKAEGSCLKLLSETTPKKTRTGFHLFSNQRGCLCFLEGLLPCSLPDDDASTALVLFRMYVMKEGSAEALIILHACIQ